MNQYLKFTVDGEERSDCSCIAIGSVVALAINLTSIGGADRDITLTVATTAGNLPVDFEALNVADPYSIATQTFSVTEPGVYTITLTVTIDGVDTTWTYEFTACPSGEIEPGNCGTWIFTNSFSTTVTVNISDAFGVQLVTGIAVLAGTSYEFTLPSPGIYILNYSYVVGGNPVTYSTPINYFCSIEACELSLLTQVLCQDAADPCCNICTEEQKQKAEMLRHELNKLTALFDYYKAVNYNLHTKWLGVFDISAERLLELQKLNDVINKIVEITKRCGLVECQKDVLATVGCGCS